MKTRRRPRSRTPAAERQAAYRARLRNGVAFVPVPVTAPIVNLVRSDLPPGEAASRDEIGRAIAAYLDRRARSDR